MDRREFMRLSAGAALSLLLPPPIWGKGPEVVVAEGDPARAVRAAVDALGGMRSIVGPGDLVLVKPNISFARPPEWSATTHPVVVGEVVRMCLEAGARRVVVADHPLHDPRKCIDRTGIGEALKGMKKGEEKTVNVDAKDAFGMPVENGTVFNTSMIFGFNATFEITSIGGVTVDIRWLPEEGQIITMPQYWYDTPVQDPHWLWENATKVVSFNNTHVTLETTPNKLDNITLYPWWEGDSTVHYNDTTISIVTTPPLDNFTISYMGYTIYGRVLNVTDDKIRIEYYAGNETVQDELNRTMEFTRQIDMPRVFNNVQKAYIEDELKQQGYSFHELAGNGVTFRIKLLRIYRVS